MKIADLSYQSVTPGNPSPNRLGLYADSGTQTVFTLISGGIAKSVGITFTGSIPSVSVHTGQGVLGTGVFFGGTGNGVVNATGLSSPYKWLGVFDEVGNRLAIPAYLLA